MVPDAAVAHDRAQQQLTAVSLLGARRAWSQLGPGDFDVSWRRLGPLLLLLLSASQRRAALNALAYVPAVLDQMDLASDPVGRVSSDGLIGIASDGRPLESLLYSAVIATRQALGAGSTLAAALGLGQSHLDRIVQTQIADAARITASVSIVNDRAVDGFVRMLQLPSCARCVVLAGKWFRWNEGFERHPGCDCKHIPAKDEAWAHAEGFVSDPLQAVREGQVRGLSAADRKAILDEGADVGQVINAHRGMYTASAFGRDLLATQEGVTARGIAGQRLAAQGGRYTRTPRLMPEQIYDLAGDDRTEALRLLTRFGYVLT